MGFFKDLKADISQAVNELLPDESFWGLEEEETEKKEEIKSEDNEKIEMDGKVDDIAILEALHEMISKDEEDTNDLESIGLEEILEAEIEKSTIEEETIPEEENKESTWKGSIKEMVKSLSQDTESDDLAKELENYLELDNDKNDLEEIEQIPEVQHSKVEGVELFGETESKNEEIQDIIMRNSDIVELPESNSGEENTVEEPEEVKTEEPITGDVMVEKMVEEVEQTSKEMNLDQEDSFKQEKLGFESIQEEIETEKVVGELAGEEKIEEVEEEVITEEKEEAVAEETIEEEVKTEEKEEVLEEEPIEKEVKTEEETVVEESIEEVITEESKIEDASEKETITEEKEEVLEEPLEEFLIEESEEETRLEKIENEQSVEEQEEETIEQKIEKIGEEKESISEMIHMITPEICQLLEEENLEPLSEGFEKITEDEEMFMNSDLEGQDVNRFDVSVEEADSIIIDQVEKTEEADMGRKKKEDEDDLTNMETMEQSNQEINVMEENKMANAELKDEITVITKGTVINGSISSDGSLEIKGTITGDVECLGKLSIIGNVSGHLKASEVVVNTPRLDGGIDSEGDVKIGVGTIVIGDVSGKSATISGAVKGEIDVQGPVVVDSTAIVKGNITAKSLQINNGAVVDGCCKLTYAEVDIDNFFEGK